MNKRFKNIIGCGLVDAVHQIKFILEVIIKHLTPYPAIVADI
jgi:hypothetical protein